MRVVTIVGARPQFVKASVVSMAFTRKAHIEEIIIHTGQHYHEKMSSVFFSEMNIPEPAYNLQLGNLPHGAMTGRMIEKIEDLLHKLNPDYLLVYGDTNSTMAGAIAAAKTKVKLVHIEAGLRSFNLSMPEEVNRIITDRLSDILFCPTSAAKNNLVNEGYKNFVTKKGFPVQIELVGDVMKDATEYFSHTAKDKCSDLIKEVIKNEFVLCTIHRPENLKNQIRLENIFDALNDISKAVPVILPMHPHTKKVLEELEKVRFENIQVIEPVGFLDMLTLLEHAKCVVTDSGGLQKEAFFFKKFCITLRDETEWVELVENGYNKLAGAETELIKNYFKMIDEVDFTNAKSLYGEGCISDKIVKVICNNFETEYFI